MAKCCVVCAHGCEYHTGKKCFACGESACANCTVIASKYYRWKNRRICMNCVEQHVHIELDVKALLKLHEFGIHI